MIKAAMITSMIWSNCATFYHTFIPRKYSTTTLAQHYSTALCYDQSCDDSRDSLKQLGLLGPSSDHDPIRFRSLVEGLRWRYYLSQVWQVSLHTKVTFQSVFSISQFLAAVVTFTESCWYMMRISLSWSSPSWNQFKVVLFQSAWSIPTIPTNLALGAFKLPIKTFKENILFSLIMSLSLSSTLPIKTIIITPANSLF